LDRLQGLWTPTIWMPRGCGSSPGVLGDEGLAQSGDVRCVVAGHPGALDPVSWPSWAEVVVATGWQRSDFVLASAYEPGTGALILVSGDGDFLHMAARHAGPVLIVAARNSRAARLGDVAAVTDPAVDGPSVFARWLAPDPHESGPA